ncbi:PadR family transcriptional regulator [Glutamicibacter sp. PS]|uniref:PadR family transcriptional regulator n=1 Tax=Glutamicibacter sp. PS TaxID=3075634 RepID=UPI00284442B3|nr:PadR family transcriptional regulator [Glutamicibacter sp. PS]MDR4534685.1 PadR family transcriptional regulator [Glutamicibacter sp. PS]
MRGTKTYNQLKRAFLPFAVLKSIQQGHTHGYAILQELEAMEISGIKSGTLYPLLRTLEEDGLVAATWETSDRGPARKIFELTADGKRNFENMRTWIDTLT